MKWKASLSFLNSRGLIYKVKKGDTIKELAKKVYKDAQKDFLIAYFNGLKVNGQIEPPVILIMPMLASRPSKKITTSAKMVADPNPEMAKDIQEIMGKARGAYGRRNYHESAAFPHLSCTFVAHLHLLILTTRRRWKVKITDCPVRSLFAPWNYKEGHMHWFGRLK